MLLYGEGIDVNDSVNHINLGGKICLTSILLNCAAILVSAELMLNCQVGLV